MRLRCSLPNKAFGFCAYRGNNDHTQKKRFFFTFCFHHVTNWTKEISNKSRSRTVIFSINVAHKRLIKHTTIRQKKPILTKSSLETLSEEFKSVGFEKLWVWIDEIRILIGPFRLFSLSTFWSKGLNQRFSIWESSITNHRQFRPW